MAIQTVKIKAPDGSWVQMVPEAPEDGRAYARENAGWAQLGAVNIPSPVHQGQVLVANASPDWQAADSIDAGNF